MVHEISCQFFLFLIFKVPALLQLPLSTSWVLCRAKHIGSVFTEVSQVQSHITECESKWLILAGDMLNELKKTEETELQMNTSNAVNTV